jgi:type IV fimbrial biogenesis protein FimT
MSSPDRHRQRGLTLLELIVALAIVAVLTTLAVPSFAGMLARHRLKAAAEQLQMDLAELRLMSAQRGQPLYLDVHAGTQWCYALAVASGCDCRVPQGCQMKSVRAADHPGVTLLEGDALVIDARSSGPSPGRPALLQSSEGRGIEGARLRVGLSPLGRPKICAPGAAVPGYPGC